MIVVILVSAVVYMVSFVLLQALSRYREFAADRGSAIITGRPSALISALMKISGTMEQIPQRDLRAASGELAAFYIFPPGQADRADLFSTHPAARGPARGPQPPRGPAAGHRVAATGSWVSSTSSPASASWRRPRPTGCSRSAPRT